MFINGEDNCINNGNEDNSGESADRTDGSTLMAIMIKRVTIKAEAKVGGNRDDICNTE